MLPHTRRPLKKASSTRAARSTLSPNIFRSRSLKRCVMGASVAGGGPGIRLNRATFFPFPVFDDEQVMVARLSRRCTVSVIVRSLRAFRLTRRDATETMSTPFCDTMIWPGCGSSKYGPTFSTACALCLLAFCVPLTSTPSRVQGQGGGGAGEGQEGVTAAAEQRDHRGPSNEDD